MFSYQRLSVRPWFTVLTVVLHGFQTVLVTPWGALPDPEKDAGIVYHSEGPFKYVKVAFKVFLSGKIYIFQNSHILETGKILFFFFSIFYCSLCHKRYFLPLCITWLQGTYFTAFLPHSQDQATRACVDCRWDSISLFLMHHFDVHIKTMQTL